MTVGGCTAQRCGATGKRAILLAGVYLILLAGLLAGFSLVHTMGEETREGE